MKILNTMLGRQAIAAALVLSPCHPHERRRICRGACRCGCRR